tara:strand:- start:588 stop:1226 length:639 start_codon:yes stop_codon:yes gene_type:complete
MKAYKYTFEKKRRLESLSKGDQIAIDSKSYLKDGEKLVKLEEILKDSTGPDELLNLLHSKALSEIENPFEIMEVLGGKPYIVRKTTVEYTVIDGGSPDLARKFDDHFMLNTDQYDTVGDKQILRPPHGSSVKVRLNAIGLPPGMALSHSNGDFIYEILQRSGSDIYTIIVPDGSIINEGEEYDVLYKTIAGEHGTNFYQAVGNLKAKITEIL